MNAKPRIGLLALTLGFYEKAGPQTRLSREAWLRGKVIPAMQNFADVEFGGILWEQPQIAREVQRLQAAGCDLLVVLCATYSPSGESLQPLAASTLPIFVWNTQELWAVDETYGMTELIANHGVHGTQDLCSVLLRNGVRFEYLTSHLNDAAPLDKLRDFATAAAAVGRLRRSRVGIVGYPFPGMDDFAVEPAYLTRSLGVSHCALALEDLLSEARAASADATADLVQQYRAAYALAPDLTDAELQATARMELGLRALVRKHSLDAVTYQFLAFADAHADTLPFVAASRMMADGIGFAGEGDVVGAIATWFFNLLQTPTTFSEIFTIDFGHNAVFMSHMGEINVALAAPGKPVRMLAKPVGIVDTAHRQLILAPTLATGPATLAVLVQGPRKTWRLIASAVEVVPSGAIKADLGTPSFKLSPARGDVRDFLTRYAQAGGPHHNALCMGDAREKIKMAAGLLGAEYFEV